MNGTSSLCPSVSIFPYNDLKPRISSTKLLWLSHLNKNEPATCGFLCIHKRNRILWVPTRATSAAPFLAATSPPNSGDFSVLFQTSAVMLLMYWIANFVVPRWVLKDLENSSDNSSEERKQDTENSSDIQ